MNGFKLKRYIPAIMAGMLTLVVAPGCVATYDDLIPGKTDKDNGELTVTVEARDFDTVDPKTRAVQNGAVMKFENGDALGLTFLDASGNIVANSDNVKYTYDSSAQAWATTGSPDFSKATRYIAYFPYSDACSGCKKESDVLAKLPIIANQADKPNYQASDVLFAEDAFTGNNIKIKFKHSRVCISFMAKSHVQGNDYNGDMNITDKLTRLDLYTGTTYMGYPTFFYYRDGVYYGIIEPQTNANLYVKISFLFGKVEYEEEEVRDFKLTSSGRWDYEPGFRYHNIIDYTVNKGKLLPEMVKEGDYVMREGDKLVVVPAQFINSDTFMNNSYHEKNYVWGKVAHRSGNLITSVGFMWKIPFRVIKCGWYVYSGNNETNNGMGAYLIWSVLPHNRNFYISPGSSKYGPHEVTALDGRSGIELTNVLLANIENSDSDVKDNAGMGGKLNEAKSAFSQFTNFVRVFYPGEREVNYPNVGGYACLSAGDVHSQHNVDGADGSWPHALVERPGGNGNLHFEAYGKGTFEMKVLMQFNME